MKRAQFLFFAVIAHLCLCALPYSYSCENALGLHPEELVAINNVNTRTTTHTSSEKHWADFQNTQVELKNLDPFIWEPAAEERISGTNIDNPNPLIGEVIAGVNQHPPLSFEPGSSNGKIEIFAGKVLKVFRINENSAFPFYTARIVGANGEQIVEITGAHQIHVLLNKSRPRITKPIGIPEVDHFPAREKKAYSVNRSVEILEEMANSLKSLNPNIWKPIGRELELAGTQIDDPKKLVGEVIAGAAKNFDFNGIPENQKMTCFLFAGKVLEVNLVTDDGQFPIYDFKILGVYGEQVFRYPIINQMRVLQKSH